MVLDWLLERRQSPENPKTSLANPDLWLFEALGARQTATGKRVSPRTALHSTAVYACVRVIAETLGALPRGVFERLEPRGRQPASSHRLHWRIHRQPNPEMTSITFFEALQGHLLTYGNAYAEIERDNAGRIVALWPLLPDQTAPERVNGQKRYVTHVGGDRIILRSDEVLHVPGLGYDGLIGYSPIAMAREAIGLGLALEEYAGRFFGNDATPGGVLEHPGTLGDEAHQRLKKSWNEELQGLSNKHRLRILEEGMKFNPTFIPNNHAQFLESRKFSVSEIARIFRVPPHLIGDLERATFSNIEHQSIDFVTHTILPWLVRWEQAMDVALFSREEQGRFFVKFIVEGLLRGDATSRSQALQVQFQNGAINIDEWREIEERNPLPDELGQKHFVPLNMQELGAAPAMDPEGITEGSETDRARLVRLSDRHRRLLEDVVARALRRELEAVRKAAVQHAADGAAWREWVDQFYARHAAYLAESLHIELEAARRYTRDHRAAILAHGLEAAAEWDTTATRELIALAGAAGADAPADRSVHVEIHPAPVNVTVPVTIPEGAIRLDVKPPDIHVAAPNVPVTIADGAVRVTSHIAAPAQSPAQPKRATTTTRVEKTVVKRDAQGRADVVHEKHVTE